MADSQRKTANLSSVNELLSIRWAAKNDDLTSIINGLDVGTYTLSYSISLTARNDTTDASLYGFRIFVDTTPIVNSMLSWGTSAVGDVKQGTATITITQENKGTFTGVWFYGCGLNASGATGTADFSNIMLNTGSTALPYEPYGWLHSLRKLGTATDTITTLPADLYTDGQPIGANLFDKSTWDNVTATRGTVDVVTNGIRLTATANDAYTQTYGNAEYSYPVTAGETYTLSWDIDNPNVYGIVYLFSGSTTGDTVLSNVVASAKKATFTIPNGHQYLSFRLGVSSSGDTLTYTNLMLIKGDTPLPYQPYAPTIIKGNMSQTGTPSPSSPIQPSECGERTAQLYFKKITNATINADGSITSNNSFDCYLAKVEANKQYIGTGFVYSFFVNEPYIGSGGSYDGQRVTEPVSNGFTAPIDGYVAVRHNSDVTDAMLNTGSTPLPYEPYGYKIPISSASTTTPIYLGEIQSTRKIRKLVLTGNETWGMSGNIVYITNFGVVNQSSLICTHFTNEQNTGMWNGNNWVFQVNISQHGMTTKSEWLTYLQAQYAAETPVTVWYVLAEPTTGIVNEPLRKIGDYADTVSGITIPTTTGADSFDVLTTLKPSEVELTYTGWHDASVKEWDGSEWQ